MKFAMFLLLMVTPQVFAQSVIVKANVLTDVQCENRSLELKIVQQGSHASISCVKACVLEYTGQSAAVYVGGQAVYEVSIPYIETPESRARYIQDLRSQGRGFYSRGLCDEIIERFN